MLDCKQTSRLLSKSMDGELSFGQRLGVKFHLAFCWMCRRYKKQLAVMHKMAHGLGATGSMGTSLPDESRRRIEELIIEEQRKLSL